MPRRNRSKGNPQHSKRESMRDEIMAMGSASAYVPFEQLIGRSEDYRTRYGRRVWVVTSA